MFRLSKFLAQSAAAAPKINRKQLITDLKRNTGFSLAQCKKALENSDFNPENAQKWLAETAKKEGWQKMEKLSSRKAKDGFVSIAESDDHLVLFELNCETDFVAKTPAFKELLVKLGENILSDGKNDVERNTAEIANSIYWLGSRFFNIFV